MGKKKEIFLFSIFAIVLVLIGLIAAGGLDKVEFSTVNTSDEEWVPIGETCNSYDDCYDIYSGKDAPENWLENNLRCNLGECEIIMPKSGGA